MGDVSFRKVNWHKIKLCDINSSNLLQIIAFNGLMLEGIFNDDNDLDEYLGILLTSLACICGLYRLPIKR